MPLNDPTQMILEAKRLVESDRRSEIRLNANGGNSILIICDPEKEVEYIDKIMELLTIDKFSIIDLNKCLINFVSTNKAELNEWFDQLQSNTNQIFKVAENDQSPDLFKEIIEQINKSLKSDRTPVLINTGSLYGTGIHNIHIMENEIVMKAALPLIILYPATIEPDRILFLGKQPASKYRCMILHN